MRIVGEDINSESNWRDGQSASRVDGDAWPGFIAARSGRDLRRLTAGIPIPLGVGVAVAMMCNRPLTYKFLPFRRPCPRERRSREEVLGRGRLHWGTRELYES